MHPSLLLYLCVSYQQLAPSTITDQETIVDNGKKLTTMLLHVNWTAPHVIISESDHTLSICMGIHIKRSASNTQYNTIHNTLKQKSVSK